eukprot:1774934-Rhodomonas_salina.1
MRVSSMCALTMSLCAYLPPASRTQTESSNPAVVKPWSLNQRLSVRWSALAKLGMPYSGRHTSKTVSASSTAPC